MPFNRVTDVKAIVLWLLVLRSDKKKQPNASSSSSDSTANSLNAKLVEKSAAPIYVPGLMLVPIPEAGFILGYIDIAFWAAFLYLLGSIFYFIDSFFLWELVYSGYSDDAANPSVYMNSIAAELFVLNALACILDWWLQFKQLSMLNISMEEGATHGEAIVLAPVSYKLSVYYFYNNFFFLGAAVVFLIQGIWFENEKTDLLHCLNGFCGQFWINFWGGMLYMLSSIFSVFEFLENRRIRHSQGLHQLPLFTLNYRTLDWFGWGDILYALTSLTALLQPVLNTFVTHDIDFDAAYYLVSNILFLVDSAFYFIGYVLYMWELQEALSTGCVGEKQAETLSALLEDSILRSQEEQEIQQHQDMETEQRQFQEHVFMNTAMFTGTKQGHRDGDRGGGEEEVSGGGGEPASTSSSFLHQGGGIPQGVGHTSRHAPNPSSSPPPPPPPPPFNLGENSPYETSHGRKSISTSTLNFSFLDRRSQDGGGPANTRRSRDSGSGGGNGNGSRGGSTGLPTPAQASVEEDMTVPLRDIMLKMQLQHLRSQSQLRRNRADQYSRLRQAQLQQQQLQEQVAYRPSQSLSAVSGADQELGNVVRADSF